MFPAMVEFLRDNGRWLGAAAVLTFASSFGQTFFIALFAAPIREELSLSHAGWGSIYAAATLGSALAIAFLGKIADRRPAALPALFVLGTLAIAALLMSAVQSIWLLVIVVFGLRFAGQGMATHVAVTAIARMYSANRGRALAIAVLGHPIGEAILPGIVVAIAAWIGWRSTWAAIGLFILVVLVPVVVWLFRSERKPSGRLGDSPSDSLIPGLGGRHWTRADVMAQPVFWALLPGVLASPLIGTAVLFQSVPLMAEKGWNLEIYALAFPAYAAGSIGAALIAGFMVDRYGASRLLPFMLLPMALGLLTVALATPVWAVFPYLAFFGITTGLAFTTMNAFWPELYGTRHLGAVRGLVSSIMVFATALGPGLTGLLLDMGVGLETQLLWMAAVTLALAANFAVLSRQIGVFPARAPS